MSLPSGYTLLDYILSTGTQYIDTGILLNSNITKIDTSYTKTSTSYRQILFGGYSSSVTYYNIAPEGQYTFTGSTNCWVKVATTS